MIILQASAKGGRNRQPLADIHRIVIFIVISPISKRSSVGPIVLNHVYPQGKNSHSHPHNQGKIQTSSQLPQEIKTKNLRRYRKKGAGDDAKSPRLKNLVGGHILGALVLHHATL